MKLLITAPYFYPKIGGMENYAWNVAKGLSRKYNLDIIVITSNHKNKELIKETIGRIIIYRLPYLFKLSNTPINPFWYFTIKKIIKTENPDVINAHSPVPFFADITKLSANKIPFILTYHSGSMIKNKFFFDIVISLYEQIFLRLLINSSSKLITSSKKFSYSNLISNKEKVTVIYPGVDTDFFKPSLHKKKNSILFVGRIEKSSEWKGLYYLLDAIAIVKEKYETIQLNIVGSGDAIDLYKKYCRKLDILNNVRFLGELHGKSLLESYQGTNMLILPSTTQAESFGIVLIEAMAVGVPVIGSNIGGIPEAINHQEDGLLVEVKNAKAIADAIKELLDNPEKAKKYGENGYKKIQKMYSTEIQIKKTMEVINEII